MNGKKITIMGIYLLIISTTISGVIAQEDETTTVNADGVGVISDAAIWYPAMGRMTYNQGNVRGNFVHFQIDENTGTIYEYIVKLSFYPNFYYSPLSSIAPYPEKGDVTEHITYQNKTIFSSIQISGFEPVAPPNAFADYLIFQAKNTLMKFYDTEGGSMNFASSTQTTKIIFEVPSGFEISQFQDYYLYDKLLEEETQTSENSEKGSSSQPLDITIEWELVSYGNATNPTHAMPDVDTYIQFNADGTFNGNVGCNSFGGNYNISEDDISFDSVFSTEMYCDKTDNQEQGVLSVFSQPDLTFQMNYETLTITNGIYMLNLRGKNIPEPPSDIDTVTFPWQTIWVKSDNTTTSISSYNGTMTINGQTIEVDLSAYGYLDVYTYVEYPAPPVVNDFWYDDLNITQDQVLIEEAKNNGVISAEGWVTTEPATVPVNAEQSTTWDQVKMANTASNNYYTYDDPTFEMTFNNINKNGVDVVVNSEISTGRIVIINVDKEVIQNTPMEDLLVSIDSAKINRMTALEDLMEKVENKDVDGAYYALSGEQLTTVFVYIPHFSTHTISISTLTSGISAVTNLLLPILLSVLFIGLFIGGILVKKGKQNDDF